MNSENDPLAQAKEFEDKEQFDLAAQYYEQAITSGVGDQWLVHQGLCRTLAKLKRFDEAFNEGRKALELNPNLPIVRSTLANIYFLRGDYSQAEEEFSLALYLEPDNSVDLKNLAIVYGALGKYNEAAESLKKVINLRPDDLEAKLALVGLYNEQKDYRAAIAEINKIFRSEPACLSLYPAYASVPVHMVSKSFIELSLLARFGVVILLYSVAAFIPAIISIPIGILLSVYILLMLIVFFNSAKGCYYISSLSFAAIVFCALYWFLVWLHYNLDSWGVPILKEYIA